MKRCISLILTLFLIGGCLSNTIEVKRIRFLFPPSYYNESLRGQELKKWGSFDSRPREVDLDIELKNTSFFTREAAKLSIEFWMAKANIIDTGIENLSKDIADMRESSEWFLLWKKEIQLEDFKPFEVKSTRITGINVAEAMERESYEDSLKGLNTMVTAWRVKVICDKSETEEMMEIDIGL